MKLLRIIICIIACMFVCTGCLYSRSVDEYSYVVIIGIDYAGGSNYAFSFLMQNESEGSESKSVKNAEMLSGNGFNVFEAMASIEASIPYKLNFARTNLLVISSEIAQSDLLWQFTTIANNNLELSQSVEIIITESKASDFLEGVSNFPNINITKQRMRLIELVKTHGTTVANNLSQFLESVVSARFDSVMPLGRSADSNFSINDFNEQSSGGSSGDSSGGEQGSSTNDKSSTIRGCALFNQTLMVGTINGDESSLLHMGRGTLEQCYTTLKRDDGTSITFMVGGMGAVDWDIHAEEQISGRIFIPLRARLIEDNSPDFIELIADYDTYVHNIGAMLTEYTEKGLSELFDKCKSLGCDAFGIGKYISQSFSDTEEWESYNYKGKYSDASITFGVNVDIDEVYVATYLN